MTVQEIIDAVQRQVVTTSSSISDSDITDIINEGVGIVAVAARWPWLLRSAQLSTVSGQQEYDLSSDVGISSFMWLDSIVDNDEEDGLLDQVSVAQYLYRWGGDPDSGSRSYQYYFKNDDTIGFVTVPDTTEASAYTVSYYRTPVVLSGLSAELPWASPLHSIMVDFAVSKLWEREEYFGERDIAFNRFLLGLNELKRFYKMRTKDSPIVFGDGGGSGGRSGRAASVYNLPFG